MLHFSWVCMYTFLLRERELNWSFMIKIVKTDNNQTGLIDICFVVGYTYICTNINLALCNHTVLAEHKTWRHFPDVNYKEFKHGVRKRINTPFLSAVGPWVLLGGSDELFCRKEMATFRYVVVKAVKHDAV